MALQGDLSEFSLPDIIQLVNLSRKTGGVHIRGLRGNQQLEGWLYFRDGRVIGAEIEGLLPLDALYAFFCCSAGPFQFHEDRTLAAPTITQNNEWLIMEGIARQEAWERMQRYIPSLQMVLRLVPNPTSPNSEISLEPEEWRVLTMVNGRSTVAQIAARSGLGELRTCEVVAALLQNGLIERKEVSLRDALFPELERIAVSSFGNSVRVLLHDAYRRAGIADLDRAAQPQIEAALDHFETAVSLLLGPPRVRPVTDDMRAFTQRFLSQ